MLPHVLFSTIQYAAGISWLVIIASIIPIIFTQPPYSFNTDGIGLMNLGPFVGNLLGSFYSGLLSDRSVRWLARRNGGYYEPEMRLYLLPPPALFMAGGIIMFWHDRRPREYNLSPHPPPPTPPPKPPTASSTN